MTAALAEDPTVAPHRPPDRGPSATQRRRPHLMPVPDREPPVQLIRHDDFLRSTVAAPPQDRTLPGTLWSTERTPLARAVSEARRGGAAGSMASPVMEHRRWSVGGTAAERRPVVEIHGETGRGAASPAAAEVGRGTDHTADSHPQPGPIPRQIHSAAGVVPRPGSAPVTTAPAPAMAPVSSGAPTARPRTFDTAARLAQATIEALAGHRPLSHLQRHFTPGVYEGIQDFPMLGGRNSVRLASLWLCEPVPDVAEVAAAFHCGPRMRALAMQLRAVDGRWMVTALQMG